MKRDYLRLGLPTNSPKFPYKQNKQLFRALYLYLEGIKSTAALSSGVMPKKINPRNVC